MNDIPIKLVIFDNDGTLMDTEWAYTWVHKEITGYSLDWDLKAKFVGKNSFESCKLMKEIYNLEESIESLSERRTKIIENCWKDIILLPGAEKIVLQLKSMNIKIAIATSSRRHVFIKKSSNFKEFIKNFDEIICGDDVINGKPSPEIFLKTLLKFKDIKPEETLIFEDSALGIKAANLAKMKSIYVPDPNINIEKSLNNENAFPTLIISSLENFDFNKFQWN